MNENREIGDSNEVQKESSEKQEDSNKTASERGGTVSKNNPFSGVMVGNRRLTSEDHFQDVRLVQFDISGSGIQYKPGDVVWIYPRLLHSFNY